MLRKVLLACGVLSSVVYIGGAVLAGLLYPEYHSYSSQMVSELMARGAPTRTLLVWLFTPHNLLVFAFTAGLRFRL